MPAESQRTTTDTNLLMIQKIYETVPQHFVPEQISKREIFHQLINLCKKGSKNKLMINSSFGFDQLGGHDEPFDDITLDS